MSSKLDEFFASGYDKLIHYKPSIWISDVYLDVGTFFTKFLRPIVDVVNDVTDPVMPVINATLWEWLMVCCVSKSPHTRASAPRANPPWVSTPGRASAGCPSTCACGLLKRLRKAKGVRLGNGAGFK